MKALLLLGVLFLAGCVSAPTLEELEDQALLTGDWSAVEWREKLIEKRELRQGPQCPGRAVAHCEGRSGQIRCECVSHSDLRRLLSWER